MLPYIEFLKLRTENAWLELQKMLLDGCDVDKMNNQIEIIKDLENQNFKSFLEKLKELIEEYSFCNHEKFKVLYVEWEFF